MKDEMKDKIFEIVITTIIVLCIIGTGVAVFTGIKAIIYVSSY